MLSVLILYGFFLNGCQNEIVGDNAEETEPAKVGSIHFIHSASTASELDIAYKDLSDNQYYSMQSGTTYGNHYGYYDFYVGDRSFIVYATNTDIVLAVGTVPLGEDQKFTLVAVDYEATIDPQLLVLEDRLDTPPQGYANVRFVHAGTDADPITITERDSAEEISQLDHLDNSGYLQLEARTHKFDIYTNQSQQPVLRSLPVTFLSGQNYTIIFSGSYDDISPIAFNAKVYRETSI